MEIYSTRVPRMEFRLKLETGDRRGFGTSTANHVPTCAESDQGPPANRKTESSLRRVSISLSLALSHSLSLNGILSAPFLRALVYPALCVSGPIDRASTREKARASERGFSFSRRETFRAGSVPSPPPLSPRACYIAYDRNDPTPTARVGDKANATRSRVSFVMFQSRLECHRSGRSRCVTRSRLTGSSVVHARRMNITTRSGFAVFRSAPVEETRIRYRRIRRYVIRYATVFAKFDKLEITNTTIRNDRIFLTNRIIMKKRRDAFLSFRLQTVSIRS